MPTLSQGRGFCRTWLFLLVLLLCLSHLPFHPTSTAAAVYRAALPIVSGPSTAPPPTSFELIDAAVTAGTISSETGLLYKVYNTFGDPRLPSQYRGDDSALSDSHALTYAVQRWDSLSSATREELRPFLTPPVYGGSWYDLRTGSPAAALPADAFALDTYPICGAVNRDKWTYDTGRVAYVKIWWPKTDLAAADIARAFLNEMDSKIWPKLTGLMGAPLTDGDTTCGGDDDRLDIYLAPVARSFEQSLTPPGCKKTPGYIVLNPSAPPDTLAHEFMHAIQDRFATANSCVYASDYAWLCEATAVWAQNYVYPATNREHYTAECFQQTPSDKLDTKNDKREYGAYLFPFYIAGAQGAPVIRTMWDNTLTNSSLDAVDKAIQGGFSEVWPRFITYNWNRAPYDFYKQWDGLTTAAKEETIEATLGGAVLKEFDVGPTELPALSASYYHVKFTDAKVRSVAYYNGWPYKVVKKAAGQDQHLDYGKAYFAEAADPEQIKGASVTAYIKIDGNWRKEDWTKKGEAGFCLDKKDERLQELVLIYGNSAHKPAGNVLTPTGERPKLVASNIGCWQWEGTVDLVARGCEGAVTWRLAASNLLWERMTSGTSPAVTYVLKRGTLNWTRVRTPCDCDDTGGSGSFSLFPVRGAAYIVSGNLILDGALHNRLSGSAADTGMITYTECNEPTTSWLPFNWAVLGSGGPVLTSEGKLDGTYTLGTEDSPEWTWKLTPKAE
jgi:hypothetical protein